MAAWAEAGVFQTTRVLLTVWPRALPIVTPDRLIVSCPGRFRLAKPSYLWWLRRGCWWKAQGASCEKGISQKHTAGSSSPSPTAARRPTYRGSSLPGGAGFGCFACSEVPLPIAAMAAARCAGVCPRLWLGFVPERAVNAATGAAGTVCERGRRVGRHGG